jgi:hypothetical protein
VHTTLAQQKMQESEESDRLIVSLDETRISDTVVSCLGLFAIPIFSKYPYVNLWEYQLVVAFRAPVGIFHIPPQISKHIKEEEMSNLFFTVQIAPTTEVNFLPHTWCFPYVQPMEKVGYENNQKVGFFSFQGSNIKPSNSCHWNSVGPHQVHIHPQKGGMCFSPNNGRMIIGKVSQYLIFRVLTCLFS